MANINDNRSLHERLKAARAPLKKPKPGGKPKRIRTDAPAGGMGTPGAKAKRKKK